MFIQTEPTPNPATLKFLPGCEVTGVGVRDYQAVEEASNSPLAQRLFDIEGVMAIFLGSDFVSVTKAEDFDWSLLKPIILGALMDHFSQGMPVLLDEELNEQAASGNQILETDDDIVKQIKEIIESRVRPAVAQDGGDIIFHKFEGGVLYLEMRGACAGCPSSTMTLKMGIENLMRHFVPEVNEVRAINGLA